MIDSERNYVDERLCGVNEMTFEEWECYQDYMIKYSGGYFGDGCMNMKTMNQTKKTIHQKKTNHPTKMMNGMRTIEVALATMTFV